MLFKTRFLTYATLVALFSVGCAASSPTPRFKTKKLAANAVPIRQPFPTQERLDELGATPVDRPLAVVGTLAAVTSWSIEPSVPQAQWRAPYAGDDASSNAFSAWVKSGGSGVPVSAAMTCLAQQYARFDAEHPETVVGADVRAFMHARCGVPFDTVRSARWSFDLDKFRPLNPKRPEPQVLALLDDASAQAVAGLGVWKGEKQVVVSVLVGEPPLELTPVPFHSGGDGYVEISGVYDQPTEWMTARVTQGAFGSKSCARLPASDPAGTFGFRCPTKLDDALEVVEVVAAPKGSVLGQVMARVLLSPDGSAPTQYDAPSLDLPATAGDFSPSAVLAGINALRGKTGLPDVVGAPKQDVVTANLFPHLLNTAAPSVRNEVAMGLIAGWQVDQTIRQGTFNTLFHHPDTPLDRILAGALFFPAFRATALSPETFVVSTAVLDDPDNSARGLLNVGYEVFVPGEFAAEEAAVLAALDDARASVDLPPVQRVEGGVDAAALSESAERIRLEQSKPGEELERMVKHFSERVGRDFYGFIYTPTLIDGWTPDFSKEFFEHEDMAVAVTVSYFTPPYSAWGQHVVFVVFTPL
ncbi:MAG: hypothetical protein ACRBN8_13055 [Nannocystales bacterium]